MIHNIFLMWTKEIWKGMPDYTVRRDKCAPKNGSSSRISLCINPAYVFKILSNLPDCPSICKQVKCSRTYLWAESADLKSCEYLDTVSSHIGLREMTVPSSPLVSNLASNPVVAFADSESVINAHKNATHRNSDSLGMEIVSDQPLIFKAFLQPWPPYTRWSLGYVRSQMLVVYYSTSIARNCVLIPSMKLASNSSRLNLRSTLVRLHLSDCHWQ